MNCHFTRHFSQITMNRYLLKLSYIGTQFRGLQKTLNKAQGPRDDTTTVQGCLELALKALCPVNPIQVTLSSRTDSGVHALETSVHVDLQSVSGYPYGISNITKVLNRQFEKREFAIRVHRVHRVSPEFHSRFNAKGRTYLYRLAAAKQSVKKENYFRSQDYISFIPIEESYRCFFVQREFDIEQLKEAAKLFVGRHDFRSFMGSNKQNSQIENPQYSVRTITNVNVKKGAPVTCSFEYEKANHFYDYWDIEITGKSFLYKQVRRMVGALISVGCGRITLRDTYEMLTIPSKNSWNPRVQVMPSFGLYLCKVHYDEEDLKFYEVESEEGQEVEIKL